MTDEQFEEVLKDMPSARTMAERAYRLGVEQERANWIDSAFAYLGYIRDHMSLLDVDAVQAFLDRARHERGQ